MSWLIGLYSHFSCFGAQGGQESESPIGPAVACHMLDGGVAAVEYEGGAWGSAAHG